MGRGHRRRPPTRVVSPPGAPEPLALGKILRGGIGRHRGAVHLLSVLAQRSGLTLRQRGVGDETNEHKAALELLRRMVLEGRVVTGDPMSCRRDLCEQVLAAGGHYSVVVEESQPELRRDVSEAFTRAADAAFSPSAAGADRAAVHRAPGRRHKHGGRVESRHLRATDLLNGYLDWPGVAQVCQMGREVRRRGGAVSRGAAYAITSVPRERADAATMPGW